MTESTIKHEIAEEQAQVSMLYDRLDVLRERAAADLKRVQGEERLGHDQGDSERDSFSTLYQGRHAQLSSVERGLVFGRVDNTDDTKFHIGRIGLFDDDYEPVLVDWRAPVAQSFYRATPADPMGVIRRRHIRLHQRTVVAVDDDLLDLEALSDPDRSTLTGEAALLASLTSHRTGRMNEIVATIQAEQDVIIRSELPGVLVVQGGPGTGKTVVALHRAAYLLYTHREQLARRGVLVVGPNATFLRYIDQVLPSLGETDVVLSTVGELFPGVVGSAPESPLAARVKGSLEMVEVLARAVRDFQAVPAEPIALKVDNRELTLTPSIVRRARKRARDADEPHNRARRFFVKAILDALTDQVVDELGREFISDDDIADLRKELREDPVVRDLLRQLWPELTPQLFVTILLSSDSRLAAAAPDLSESERAALVRANDAPWTASDVALLDEAAELLGDLDSDVYARKQGAVNQAVGAEEHLDYIRGVIELESTAHRIVLMPWEVEQFTGMLAQWTTQTDAVGTLAERAAADRTWQFGHVIVDEAQELSAMDWRLLMRRVPRRSMTLVGDIAQTGSAAGTRSWAEVLDRYAPRRWRTAELSVNYRTPAEIMAVAADVLAAIDPSATPPTSVRDTGVKPWSSSVPAASFGSALVAAVRSEQAEVGDGRLAVLVPSSRYAELTSLLASQVEGVAFGTHPGVLDSTIAVLDVGQAKGLEFDSVLIADPSAIVASSVRGLSDLYVAVTRATKRLGVVCPGPIPEMLTQTVQTGGMTPEDS
ncbi:HelD family protein [Tenggerimyces flavus]|uniref:HelD family protein n=1 Tax=Tenggerimyces flavus TaxID=1708749 RepID=A0ABV7YP12_9ACTN|nr:ATP-binding domain-containing protein [Tenggerimyces flavus]MBM7789483.1 DNA helicase IV [Tenggerimyces flavus]